jgi:hypothetical protein
MALKDKPKVGADAAGHSTKGDKGRGKTFEGVTTRGCPKDEPPAKGGPEGIKKIIRDIRHKIDLDTANSLN